MIFISKLKYTAPIEHYTTRKGKEPFNQVSIAKCIASGHICHKSRIFEIKIRQCQVPTDNKGICKQEIVEFLLRSNIWDWHLHYLGKNKKLD